VAAPVFVATLVNAPMRFSALLRWLCR
jgi:hypothetical protein